MLIARLRSGLLRQPAGVVGRAVVARRFLSTAGPHATDEAGASRAPRANVQAEKLLNQEDAGGDDDEVDLVEMFNAETGEWNGPRYGKEPTRYGDWEIKGRCTDFT